MHPIQTHDLLIALDAAIDRYEQKRSDVWADTSKRQEYEKQLRISRRNINVLQRAKVILAELREYE